MYNQDDKKLFEALKRYEREKAFEIGMHKHAQLRDQELLEKKLEAERKGQDPDLIEAIDDDWDGDYVTSLENYLADAHEERRRRMQADMDTNLFEDWTDGPAEGWTWVEDLEVDPETVCDPNNKDLLLEAVDEIASLKKQLATMQAEYDTLIEEHHELIRANMKLGVPF